jgi:predicted amidohydrolase
LAPLSPAWARFRPQPSRASATMLRKVGFFHYGDEQLGPAESLRASLTETSRQDLRDCLVVTPEAFNIRNGYWNPNRFRDPSVKASLAQISRDFGIALVVGLVEENDGGEPGYSSAYLIDHNVCHLLSRKGKHDGSNNYQVCESAKEKGRPVPHRGIAMGALVCMDAADLTSPLRETHTAPLAAFQLPHAVLCVPARMQTCESRSIAKRWPTNLTVVVANAGTSQPSVIRPAGDASDAGMICYQEPNNRVRVISLANRDHPGAWEVPPTPPKSPA